MDRREDDPEPHVIFSKHLGVKMEVIFIWGFCQGTHKNHVVFLHKESKLSYACILCFSSFSEITGILLHPGQEKEWLAGHLQMEKGGDR